MQDFLYNLSVFIWNFLDAFYLAVDRFVTNSSSASRLGISTAFLNAFLDKTIISGDLITFGLTWRHLIIYFLPLFIGVIFIILFVKLVFAVFKMIRF